MDRLLSCSFMQAVQTEKAMWTGRMWTAMSQSRLTQLADASVSFVVCSAHAMALLIHTIVFVHLGRAAGFFTAAACKISWLKSAHTYV